MLGSILPTFYVRLFHTKVSRKAFFVLAVKVQHFIGKEYRRKCAYKMLVKLTPRELSLDSEFHFDWANWTRIWNIKKMTDVKISMKLREWFSSFCLTWQWMGRRSDCTWPGSGRLRHRWTRTWSLPRDCGRSSHTEMEDWIVGSINRRHKSQPMPEIVLFEGMPTSS
jgi:hypothetical protein